MWVWGPPSPVSKGRGTGHRDSYPWCCVVLASAQPGVPLASPHVMKIPGDPPPLSPSPPGIPAFLLQCPHQLGLLLIAVRETAPHRMGEHTEEGGARCLPKFIRGNPNSQALRSDCLCGDTACKHVIKFK